MLLLGVAAQAAAAVAAAQWGREGQQTAVGVVFAVAMAATAMAIATASGSGEVVAAAAPPPAALPPNLCPPPQRFHAGSTCHVEAVRVCILTLISIRCMPL